MPLRIPLRALLRRPAYTLLAVGALALGVAGTTSVYSLVHTVLVDGLPYENVDRLVTPDVRSTRGYLISISLPNYRDWGERSRSFEDWGGSAGWSFVRPGASAAGGAEIMGARLIIGDFFGVLGLQAAQGRLARPEETQPGAPPVAVLGYGFWQSAFGGDPDIIGRPLVTDEFTATIIGVLRAGAGYPTPDVEAYIPMGIISDQLPWDDRDSSFGTRAIARLAPGVTLDAAQTDLSRVAREIALEEGEEVATPELRRLDDLFLGDVRTGLWTLMGAVALLLLIACANVANLALVRGDARGRELAVRMALGAGRKRLVGLLLVESGLLAIAGGTIGLALAAVAVRALPGLLPLDLPAVAGHVALNGPVVVFAVGVTALSAVLFGLIPSLRLGRGGSDNATTTLRQGTRSLAGRESRRLRDGLVIAQVALSLVLLVGAGLLTKSLSRLAGVDKGFDAEYVVTARLAAPEGLFETSEARWAFHDALEAELEASPDVLSATSTLLIPLAGRSWERRIAPEGASLAHNDMESVLWNVVSDGYFETLGIPIVRGRPLTIDDDEGSPRVTVIDETMADAFWPGEDPIGKRVTFNSTDDEEPIEWHTVVGVAANTRHYELRSPSRIQAYVPMRQTFPVGLGVAMKTRPEGEAAGVDRLKRALADLAPTMAYFQLQTLEDLVADELGPSRSLGTLTAVFALFAVLLSALGIFGVLSLAVTRRRREVGVRIAVGATPAEIIGLVAYYGIVLVSIGAVVGVAVAVAATRLIGSLLFQVEPFDPAVYGEVTAGLLAVAALAAAAPAARAASVDPAKVLRED